MGHLDGKVAIVTGAGGGIGRATALLLAEEGAELVVNDLGTSPAGAASDRSVATRVAEELCARGYAAEPSFDDVSTPAGAAAVATLALERFGRLDVLVCAAGATIDGPILELELASYRRVLELHLDSTFLCIQHAARQMVQQRQGGRIVTITGLSGLIGRHGQASHATAMAGIYGLTRAAAIELQRHGITVNAIAPVALTRLTAAAPELQGLGGELSPEHVAPAALFLASELCGTRSGEVLGVAGRRLYRLKVMESRGKLKDGDAPWTAAEIAEHWESLAKT